MTKKLIFVLLIAISIFTLTTTDFKHDAFAATRGMAVRDVDNPNLQPFQIPLDWTNDPTQLGSGASFTAPSGKRLVIEQISGQAALAIGLVFSCSVSTYVNGTLAAHRFSMELVPIGGGDYAKYWLMDKQVRIYADPGATVTISVANNLGGDGAGWFTVSGYLTDVP